MRNIKAMLIALVLFIVSVIGIKAWVMRDIPGYNLDYGTWIQAAKFGSNSGLKNLLEDDNAIAIFGSSELRHGQGSRFHANSIFKQTDLEPVFIGQGGYQSLCHSIALGSVGEELRSKKVVISISPQWFKKDGVSPNAFGASYSESNFIAFLRNKQISKETKKYVIDRAKQLTNNNSAMEQRIENDVKWYGENNVNAWENFRKSIHSYLVNEKSSMKLFLTGKVKGVWNNREHQSGNDEVNWNQYYKKSIKKGKKVTGKNDLGMVDNVYDKKFKFRRENNLIGRPRYSLKSIEYQDLEAFMKICKEENIQMMAIVLPYNGRWCDYVNITKDFRDKSYDKVKKLAKKYGAEIADLSGYEYSDFIFEDDSHLALKGLVKFNEQIYDFYKQYKK